MATVVGAFPAGRASALLPLCPNPKGINTVKKNMLLAVIIFAATVTFSPGVAYADTATHSHVQSCNTGAAAIRAFFAYMMSITPGKVVTNPPPLGCN
jgi:hypothetical protein